VPVTPSSGLTRPEEPDETAPGRASAGPARPRHPPKPLRPSSTFGRQPRDEGSATHCTACGTETRPGSKFCDNCGTPLAASCPACGESNRADAHFCASCGTPLAADAPRPAAGAAPPQQPSIAERRLVTVLFTDLVGFTTLAEDRDPEAVRELLSRYFDAATRIVQLHGGTVEKFIGDAVMAVWGTPVAHEDDAERAVRAALELIDAVRALHPGLQARAGVLTGEAAVTLGATNQGMVAGDLVNTAARLQGVAEAGTVLVGETTRHAAENAIVFEPLGEHALKGKVTPVPAWRAIRVVAQRGGQGRADALEPPFVGRDEELRQLKETLHAVGRERRPRLVSITGPAGIGKSRLVWELEKYVDGIAEDVYWHRGRSPSYGEGITFWALGEMVRRRARLAEDDDEATTRERIARTVEEFVPVPEQRPAISGSLLALLGAEEAPPDGRDRLFPAWRSFFEQIAERGTTVLVFEDLQWADAGLLDFIDHLLEWSRALPILVITLARPELFDRRPDWGAGRRSFVAMALEPLPPEAMRLILEGLIPGVPATALETIIARADGVPLYAVETVRALLAQGRIERAGDEYRPVGNLGDVAVPESLRSLIASRLDALSPDDRALMQAASVLGQVFSAGNLAAVVGETEPALEPRLRGLVRRELVELETDAASPERGQYKFMQSLIREVAYATLGRRERRKLHLAVARHYEALGDEELAGALANHYLAAYAASDEGSEADALAAQARLALRGAAERAAALGAHQQAIAYLEEGLRVTTDVRERADLLSAAAYSAGVAALEGAPERAAEAVRSYRDIGDLVGVARASALRGKLLLDASQLESGAAVLEAALAAVPDDAPEVEAELAATLARAYMRLVRSEEAVVMADRALVIAERLNLEDVVAEGFVNKGSALGMLGRRREALLLAEGAARLARGGRADREMRIRHNLAIHMIEDEPRRAADELETVLELARRVGDHGHYRWILGTLAIQSLKMGRELEDLIVELREAVDAADIKVDRGRLRASLGLIEAARGEHLDAVLADLHRIFGDTTDHEELFYRDLPTADVLFAQGRYLDAYGAAIRHAQLESQAPDFGLQSASRAAVALADLERARDVRDRVFALPFTGSVHGSLRERARGAVLALEGDGAEAMRHFREAYHVVRDLGVELDQAQLAVDVASILPDQPEVDEWLAEARPVLERVRAAPDLARLEAIRERRVQAPAASTPTPAPNAASTAGRP